MSGARSTRQHTAPWHQLGAPASAAGCSVPSGALTHPSWGSPSALGGCCLLWAQTKEGQRLGSFTRQRTRAPLGRTFQEHKHKNWTHAVKTAPRLPRCCSVSCCWDFSTPRWALHEGDLNDRSHRCPLIMEERGGSTLQCVLCDPNTQHTQLLLKYAKWALWGERLNWKRKPHWFLSRISGTGRW